MDNKELEELLRIVDDEPEEDIILGKITDKIKLRDKLAVEILEETEKLMCLGFTWYKDTKQDKPSIKLIKINKRS